MQITPACPLHLRCTYRLRCRKAIALNSLENLEVLRRRLLPRSETNRYLHRVATPLVVTTKVYRAPQRAAVMVAVFLVASHRFARTVCMPTLQTTERSMKGLQAQVVQRPPHTHTACRVGVRSRALPIRIHRSKQPRRCLGVSRGRKREVTKPCFAARYCSLVSFTPFVNFTVAAKRFI